MSWPDFKKEEENVALVQNINLLVLHFSNKYMYMYFNVYFIFIWPHSMDSFISGFILRLSLKHRQSDGVLLSKLVFFRTILIYYTKKCIKCNIHLFQMRIKWFVIVLLVNAGEAMIEIGPFCQAKIIQYIRHWGVKYW